MAKKKRLLEIIKMLQEENKSLREDIEVLCGSDEVQKGMLKAQYDIRRQIEKMLFTDGTLKATVGIMGLIERPEFPADRIESGKNPNSNGSTEK